MVKPKSRRSRKVSTSTAEQVEGAIPPSDFWIPPPTSKESDRIGFRLDSQYVGMMQRLVESGVFGWSKQSDFLRWATQHGVDTASKVLQDESFSNEVKVMRGILRRSQLLKREALFMDTLKFVRQDIAGLLEQGAKGDARLEFKKVLSEAEGLSISRYKERFMRELKTAFPELRALAGETKRGS